MCLIPIMVYLGKDTFLYMFAVIIGLMSGMQILFTISNDEKVKLTHYYRILPLSYHVILLYERIQFYVSIDWCVYRNHIWHDNDSFFPLFWGGKRAVCTDVSCSSAHVYGKIQRCSFENLSHYFKEFYSDSNIFSYNPPCLLLYDFGKKC